MSHRLGRIRLSLLLGTGLRLFWVSDRIFRSRCLIRLFSRIVRVISSSTLPSRTWLQCVLLLALDSRFRILLIDSNLPKVLDILSVFCGIIPKSLGERAQPSLPLRSFQWLISYPLS